MKEDELAEVCIDGHHHSAFSDSKLKECSITWVRTQILSEQHVVALVGEPAGEPLAGTSIYKELHPPATETAARESPATTACAYATQARMSSGSSRG